MKAFCDTSTMTLLQTKLLQGIKTLLSKYLCWYFHCVDFSKTYELILKPYRILQLVHPIEGHWDSVIQEKKIVKSEIHQSITLVLTIY